MEYLDGRVPVQILRIWMPVRHRLAALTVFSPCVVWLVLFFLIPLFIVLAYSFARPSTYGGVVFSFTLQNYARFFAPLYFKIFLTSLWVSVLTTVVCLLVGYPVAYYISTRGSKWKSTLLVLVILPFWTSTLVRTYAWMTILRTEGIVNTLLISLGIIQNPLKLLYTPGAVVLGFLDIYLPFMILPLYTSIEKMDFSLLEAALDLGANRVKAFLNVTLPNTMPGVIAGVMLVFIPTIGSFVVPELLGGSKVFMIGNLIQNQFLQVRNWAFGSAASFILLAFVLACMFVYFKVSGQDRIELM